MNEINQTASKKLVAYAVTCPGFRIVSKSPRHWHIGALLADGALQAGLNYRTVVYPRVARIEQLFPSAADMVGLRRVLRRVSASEFLKWSHGEKIARFEHLFSFFQGSVKNVDDIAYFLGKPETRAELARLRGIGLKTVDYLFRLSGGIGVAVDRHVIRFVESAGIVHRHYSTTKQVVDAAADLLGVPRDCFDASIWQYMSRVGSFKVVAKVPQAGLAV